MIFGPVISTLPLLLTPPHRLRVKSQMCHTATGISPARGHGIKYCQFSASLLRLKSSDSSGVDREAVKADRFFVFRIGKRRIDAGLYQGRRYRPKARTAIDWDGPARSCRSVREHFDTLDAAVPIMVLGADVAQTRLGIVLNKGFLFCGGRDSLLRQAGGSHGAVRSERRGVAAGRAVVAEVGQGQAPG